VLFAFLVPPGPTITPSKSCPFPNPPPPPQPPPPSGSPPRRTSFFVGTVDSFYEAFPLAGAPGTPVILSVPFRTNDFRPPLSEARLYPEALVQAAPLPDAPSRGASFYTTPFFGLIRSRPRMLSLPGCSLRFPLQFPGVWCSLPWVPFFLSF